MHAEPPPAAPGPVSTASMYSSVSPAPPPKLVVIVPPPRPSLTNVGPAAHAANGAAWVIAAVAVIVDVVAAPVCVF